MTALGDSPLAKPKEKSEKTAGELQRFIRVVELPLKAGEQFRGYQPEVVWLQDDQVVRRELLGKPNLFEYAYTQAGEFIDPRNESVDA